MTKTITRQAMTEARMVGLLTRRINLSAEMRGSLSIGDGRSREVIRDELRSVEAELSGSSPMQASA